jgi:hypothetical protein
MSIVRSNNGSALARIIIAVLVVRIAYWIVLYFAS